MYLSKDNRGDNRLYPHQSHVANCPVDVVPIDQLLAELAIEQVDVIKMDIQGYEGHALAGMTATLQRNEQLVMLTEFWPAGRRQAGSDPRQVLQMLRAARMTLFRPRPDGGVAPVGDDDDLMRQFSGTATH